MDVKLRTVNGFEHLEMSHEFEDALQAMHTGTHPLFITGKAGTGKSTLLRYFRLQSPKKKVILAPTGVAALNVQGETIHSFFKFRSNVTIEDARKAGSRLKSAGIYGAVETIVIDEISMVRADLLDCMDEFLKAANNTCMPFGGKRIIMIGDLYQLPPVITKDEAHYFKSVYRSPYFFSSQVIQSVIQDLELIELSKIYRQSDADFIALLNGIRDKSLSSEGLATLNKRVWPKTVDYPTDGIYLSSTNAKAAEVNAANLDQLTMPVFRHSATCSKKFDLKMAPTDADLKLKIGAKVMFVSNHPAGLWVNGTLGVIEDILEDDLEVVVRTEEGQPVVVSPHKWQTYKYLYDAKNGRLEQESAGSFTQFPLKLAWAVTIHKSQGKTFKEIMVDLGWGAFANGQVYVALSRAESMEGVHLKQPIRHSDIRVDPTISLFLSHLNGNTSEERQTEPEKVRLISSAIDSDQELEIVYLSEKREATTRRVFPKRIGPLSIKDPQVKAVQCFCYERQAVRVFRIDRILEVR